MNGRLHAGLNDKKYEIEKLFNFFPFATIGLTLL